VLGFVVFNMDIHLLLPGAVTMERAKVWVRDDIVARKRHFEVLVTVGFTITNGTCKLGPRLHGQRE
jgi:hypothetical protein